jgi:hypothetical protein
VTRDEELKGIQFEWATKHSVQSNAQETQLSSMLKWAGTRSCMNHVLRRKLCGRPLILVVPVEKFCRGRRHHIAAELNIIKNITPLDSNGRILVMVLLDYCVQVSCSHCC